MELEPQPVSVLAKLAQGRAAIGRNGGARADLLALNAILKLHGAPSQAFGAVDGVPVGLVLQRRAELAAAGVHRHFLSDVTPSVLGVESIIVPPPGVEPRAVDDYGERLLLRGWCAGASDGAAAVAAGEACLRALQPNESSRRPIRVVRVVEGAGGEGGPGYRYDGLYLALRRTSAAAEMLGASTEPCYLLVRAPSQPPLPPAPVEGSAVGGGPAAAEAAAAAAVASSHMGLGVEERDPLAYLPSELEAVAGDARRVSVEEALSFSALVSLPSCSPRAPLPPPLCPPRRPWTRHRCVCRCSPSPSPQALRRLLAARKALVASMEPHEVLEVAALREASVRRIRAAVEMLHAPDDPSSALLPPPTLPPWPSRLRNSA